MIVIGILIAYLNFTIFCGSQCRGTFALQNNKESLFGRQQREQMELKKWAQHQEQKHRAKQRSNSTSAAQIGYSRLKELNDKLGSEKDYYISSSLQPPFHMISFWNTSDPIIEMKEEERNGKGRCSFLGSLCAMEMVEHHLVDRYIASSDTVLEVGARFGTTSCTIASKQSNSGRLVAVEPDDSVWHILSHNQRRHNCNFWTVRGVISNSAHSISPQSYGTRSVKDRKGQAAFYTYSAIQNITNQQFSVLLIDCEGCIDELFLEGNETVVQLDTLKHSLASVHTIILEADMSHLAPDCYKNCVHYDQWVDRLRVVGFQKVHQEVDPKFWFIFHYVFQRRPGIM